MRSSLTVRKYLIVLTDRDKTGGDIKDGYMTDRHDRQT